jgi:hypothetical protein
MPNTTTDHPSILFDRLAATLAALMVVALAIFLLVRNQPFADPGLFFVMRVVVSLSAATLGATAPGFLKVSWSGSGFKLRAAGALALFVLTFVYTPDLVTDQSRSTPHINQNSQNRSEHLSSQTTANTDKDQYNLPQLVGTWKADTVEFGVPTQIIWQAMPNGTTSFLFRTSLGEINQTGKWSYSDGLLYETFSLGQSATGSIHWFDKDHFELTILNVSDPQARAYIGLKRHYFRL